MHYLSEENIFIFLIQFFLLLGLSKLAAIPFKKLRQPTITADILVGVILGPTLLGRFFPDLHRLIFPVNAVQQNMLETVAWTGILFLLLVTGLEVNFSSVWKQRKSAIKISASDLILPIMISAIPIYFLPQASGHDQRFLFTLFLATIMTLSAMPVAIRAMHDLNLLKTDMGFLVISALSLNDIVGWVVFTVILGVFTQASVNFSLILTIVLSTVGFTVMALTLGKFLVGKTLNRVRRFSEDSTAGSLTVVCLTGFLFGAITQGIGIHSLFGFFLAGLIAGESKDLSEKSRNMISKMIYAVFVPVFFANIGLKIDLFQSFNLWLALFITVIGVLARYAAAYLGAKLSKSPKNNWKLIAILHTPGGEMHIVIGILALEYQLITQEIFVAIIVGAVLSSVFLGPWLSLALKGIKKTGLLRFFSEEGILPEVRVLEKSDFLNEMILKAGKLSGIETEKIQKAVFDREELMSTGLEKGIALPHGRIAGLQTPLVIFARSVSGIEWNSLDGNPIRLVFLILTPEGKADLQLEIYSALGFLFQDPVKRSFLLEEEQPRNLWSFLEKEIQAYSLSRGMARKKQPLEGVKNV